MGLNLSDALNTKVEDIERPPLMPVGTYRWMVEKPPAIDTIADGRFDVCDFTLKCLGAQDDVDADDLAAFEEKAGSVSNQRRRHRFLFNKEDEASFKKTEYYLKDFIQNHLGVGEQPGMSLKELLSAAQNMTCLGSIAWRPDRDNPEVMYDEIRRTAPAE